MRINSWLSKLKMKHALTLHTTVTVWTRILIPTNKLVSAPLLLCCHFLKLGRISIKASVFLMVLALAACSGRDNDQPTFTTVDVTGAPWGKDFQLMDHAGKSRRLADFRGKVVVLFFGYVNCPDVCPTNMAELAAALTILGPDADRVQVLMVTLDPKRDTPDILRQYVPAFHPSFLGLYGDEQATANIAKEFKVFFKLQKPGESGFYTVDHSGGLFVFDPLGNIRLYISDEHSPEIIARDLQTLIKQSDVRDRR